MGGADSEWRDVLPGEDIAAGRVLDCADVLIGLQGHAGLAAVYTDGVRVITRLDGNAVTTAPRV